MDYSKYSKGNSLNWPINFLQKDMMNDYPNCRYQGCDMVDVINRKTMPEQLRFSTGNVVEGLPYADNTFDFVHMRLFVLALRSDEWPKAIKEILRVTKPGGIVQVLEPNLDVSDVL